MSVDKKSPVPAKDRALSETNSRTFNNVIPDKTNIVKNTLETAFNSLLKNAENLDHGIVSLELHFRDGQPWRYSVNRNESFIIGEGE
jgi:hypothetical protein